MLLLVSSVVAPLKKLSSSARRFRATYEAMPGEMDFVGGR